MKACFQSSKFIALPFSGQLYNLHQQQLQQQQKRRKKQENAQKQLRHMKVLRHLNFQAEPIVIGNEPWRGYPSQCVSTTQSWALLYPCCACTRGVISWVTISYSYHTHIPSHMYTLTSLISNQIPSSYLSSAVGDHSCEPLWLRHIYWLQCVCVFVYVGGVRVKVCSTVCVGSSHMYKIRSHEINSRMCVCVCGCECMCVHDEHAVVLCECVMYWRIPCWVSVCTYILSSLSSWLLYSTLHAWNSCPYLFTVTLDLCWALSGTAQGL